MDTSREIKEDSSFNMTLLILVIGLVGIGGALLFNNIRGCKLNCVSKE